MNKDISIPHITSNMDSDTEYKTVNKQSPYIPKSMTYTTNTGMTMNAPTKI